jgi:hypothetical protein
MHRIYFSGSHNVFSIDVDIIKNNNRYKILKIENSYRKYEFKKVKSRIVGMVKLDDFVIGFTNMVNKNDNQKDKYPIIYWHPNEPRSYKFIECDVRTHIMSAIQRHKKTTKDTTPIENIKVVGISFIEESGLSKGCMIFGVSRINGKKSCVMVKANYKINRDDKYRYKDEIVISNDYFNVIGDYNLDYMSNINGDINKLKLTGLSYSHKYKRLGILTSYHNKTNENKKGGLLWYVNWFDHSKSLGFGLHPCHTKNSLNAKTLNLDGDVQDMQYFGNQNVLFLYTNGIYSHGYLSENKVSDIQKN